MIHAAGEGGARNAPRWLSATNNSGDSQASVGAVVGVKPYRYSAYRLVTVPVGKLMLAVISVY